MATSLPLAVIFALAGLFTYTTIVLGIDWIIGQLRPKRAESRSFDRDRRPGQRPTGGRYQSPGRSAGPSSRPVGRPSPEPRRDRERSPFEMGVSNTPVLDIDSPRSSGSSSTPASRSEAGSKPDFRTRPSRDSQVESERPATPDKDRDSQSDSRRYVPRDRGGRPERREGSHDRQFDRSSREGRGDRPQRDRGPRPSRFDRHDSQRSPEPASVSESAVKPVTTVDATSISEDLARVRQQLDRNVENQPQKPIVEAPPKQPSPIERPAERPAPENVQEAQPSTTEMHYGRGRHRKPERPESEPHPGVEPPPMPEMVDHYSTDDMAFGRGKRKKIVK